MKDILVYGAGGYGREVACLINKISRSTNEWNFIGYIDDDPNLKGVDIDYGHIYGGIDVLNSWNKPVSIVIAIASPKHLESIVNKITNKNIDFPTIIDPETSFLDYDSFRIGKGNIIGYGCRFSCNVGVGDFNIIIHASTFGHDVIVGNYNVFFPDSRLSGDVKVGNQNFFGMRTAVLQGFTVGNNSKIGAGSFVMRNVKDGLFYMGNPAKKVNL